MLYTEYSNDVSIAANKCEIQYDMFGQDSADKLMRTLAKPIAKDHGGLISCVIVDIENYVAHGEIL
jgi:hypothetical protein